MKHNHKKSLQDIKPSFFRQLREKYWDGPRAEEGIDAPTKHQHGRKRGQEKIVVYFLLGLTVASTLGALASQSFKHSGS